MDRWRSFRGSYVSQKFSHSVAVDIETELYPAVDKFMMCAKKFFFKENAYSEAVKSFVGWLQVFIDKSQVPLFAGAFRSTDSM